jgi:hypothetical protein
VVDSKSRDLRLLHANALEANMKTGTVLPDSFLRRIDPKDRPAGKAGVTTEEAQSKYAKGQEKKLQSDCVNLLKLRGIWHRQMPFGKRPPNGWGGWPDLFIVLKTGCLFVEVKSGVERQSADQLEFMCSLPDPECYHVIYNLQQLQALLPK